MLVPNVRRVKEKPAPESCDLNNQQRP